MKVAVKTATGQALAWMAAQALGDEAPEVKIINGTLCFEDPDADYWFDVEYDPVNDPAVLVHVLEKAHIVLVPHPEEGWSATTGYGIQGTAIYAYAEGLTASEAALRAFIGSAVGEYVEVPDELCVPPTDPATAG